MVAIHLSLAAGDGRQEWERCYYLAKCRSLAQDHSGRVELPALGRDNSSSVQEAREVTRFVVEDLNDNLFVELVGYMHEASAPKPKPWGHKSPVVKAFRRAWRYVQQKVHQGVQWVRGRMQRVNWQRLWRRPAFRLIICSVTGTITWIIMIHVLPITAILWVGIGLYSFLLLEHLYSWAWWKSAAFRRLEERVHTRLLRLGRRLVQRIIHIRSLWSAVIRARSQARSVLSLRYAGIPDLVPPYFFSHLRSKLEVKVPSLVPERHGPSISSHEYRVPPSMKTTREPIIIIKRDPNHPDADQDDDAVTYSAIRFAICDTVVYFGPCDPEKPTTWLSRKTLQKIKRRREAKKLRREQKRASRHKGKQCGSTVMG